MKKSIFGLVLLSVLVSCGHHTQKKRYYKDLSSGNILTEEAYNKTKNFLKKRLKNVKGKTTLSEVFTDSIVSGDSIIKTFELKVTKGSVIKKPNPIYSYMDKKLPAHTFITMEGKKVNPARMEGKPTLINFWFTTCHPCIDEMPVLNEIRKKYKGKVNFISITFNSKEEVTEFLKTHRYDFIKIVDAKNYIDSLRIKYFPISLFLDKDGIVRKVENGIPYEEKNGKMVMGNGSAFESYLNSLL